jgi:hypothetical protein
MSVMNRFRVLVVCAALQMGVFSGVPMIDVTGEWRVKGNFGELICTFDQHDAVLTGSCAPSGGPEGARISGAVRDRDIEWRFDIALSERAKKQTVTFSGSIEDGARRVKGTFAIADRKGDFVAERE